MPTTDDTRPLELIFKASCPYCTIAAGIVTRLDVLGKVRATPIETPRAQELIEDHHGEFVNSPHLFTPDYVYYGVSPTAVGLLKEYVMPRLG